MLNHNFMMKEIEKCEDCSCKWSRTEASFSAVKTEAHTVGQRRGVRCFWVLIAEDMLWLSVGT